MNYLAGLTRGLLGWKGAKHARARRGFWWCCCSGSGQGSQAGSSVSGFPQSCCEVELGAWPGGYPATIFLTITNACCASLNQTVTLTQTGTAYAYQSAAVALVGCNGANVANVSVACELLNGVEAWVLGIGSATYQMELLSCNPLHMRALGISLNFGPPAGCVGTFDAEVTE